MNNDKSLYTYYRSIPIGKDRAVSRAQLCRLWNMGDRSVRLTVAEIRDKAKALNLEYFIVSDSQKLEQVITQLRQMKDVVSVYRLHK